MEHAPDLRHGPDRRAFALGGRGLVAGADGVPFHGIASMGLLERLNEWDPDGRAWECLAHRLDSDDDDPPHDLLPRLRAVAREMEVLGFEESARAALLASRLHPVFAVDPVGWTVCNLKEGHVSSVWSVEKDGTRFAVNVARDRPAGPELEASAAVLVEVTPMLPPGAVADVIACAKVEMDGKAISVSLNRWIDQGMEVHRARDRRTGKHRLVAVDRFVSNGGVETPARIRGIVGRYLLDEEAREVERLSADFEHATDGRASIGINRGDVVWSAAGPAIVDCRSADWLRLGGRQP